MKKIFTLSVAVALCASLNAEEVKILTCGLGIPGFDEPQLMGLGISPNGKYICGAIESGSGIFVANYETGEVKWNLSGDEGGELRHVDNSGVAVGITDCGIKYTFQTGEETTLTPPEGYRSVLAEAITNDGSLIVGSLTAQSFVTTAAYSVNGVDWTLLPIPTKEELGSLDPRSDGSAAKYVSADGKVIFGHLGSFGVPIAWIRNDEGKYDADFFLARLDDQDLASVSGMYLNMSNNGKYLLMVGRIYNAQTQYTNAPIVYNTETKEITVYKDPQPIDDAGNGLYPTAISDDGTIIGTVGQPYFNSYGTFIIKAGQTTAEFYNDVFPKYDKTFGVSDMLGFNMPTGISADGRYILGYTFYCEDYNDIDADAYYVTYVIDTQSNGDNSVEGVGADNAVAVPVGYYNLQGQSVSATNKGVNIVRMSDGSTRKVINK